MRIGFHISIAGGLPLAVGRALEAGCTTMQIFTHSPRMWAFPNIPEESVRAFRQARQESGIAPLYVHTSYLINLASPDDALFYKSIEALRQEILLAERVGAEHVVTHLGTSQETDRTAAARRVADGLRQTHDGLELDTRLLLENTAGERGDAGSHFDEIARMMELSGVDGLGVALDTCHGFGAGYDFRTREGVEDIVGEIDAAFGLDRVKLVHLNDSMHNLGSHRDRHQDIGKGHIGEDGFRAILTHPRLREIPFVMETPKNTAEDDLRNMKTALRLAAAR